MTDDLAAAFAACGVTALWSLPGGHRSTISLVERAGQRLVATTSTDSEPGLRWLQFLHEVAERCGLNPPRLLPDDFGRYAEGGLTLEPFVEGRQAGPRDVESLGSRMRAFHALTSGFPDRPGDVSSRRMLRRTGVPLTIRERLARALDRLPSGRDAAVHGDLTAANVILSAEGPVLIDWDEARRDRSAFDLPVSRVNARIREVRAAWELAASWQPEPERARRLARQYHDRPVSSPVPAG